LGPRLLFFSGGTALRELSRHLIEYTHNSIHLITPFDSGGSSARIREAFGMLAVGDLRNRLMALADKSTRGNPEVFLLFAFRFPKRARPEGLKRRLRDLVDGRDRMIGDIPEPMRTLIRNHLRFFQERMPADLDLRGANIGNLILAGGYLNQDQHIDPVIYLFSKLVEVRGVVRPVSSSSLHLAAKLANGRTVVGQHLLTGKNVPALDAPVQELYLTPSLQTSAPTTLEVQEKISDLIRQAELICYPVGSFYSSLIANLLPLGVGQAIAETDVPKIYVPNNVHDPELVGVSPADTVQLLLSYLRKGCREPVETRQLLQYVLVDARSRECDNVGWRRVEQLGVTVVELPLVTQQSAPLLDPRRLAEALLSFA
jgi:CofD-related protein of GAK system